MSFLPPTFRVAMLALRRNVLRSALTTLGIVIGVGAVIAMVEIGQGSKKAVAESIQSLGANNLLVMPGQAASGGVSFGGGTSNTLTPADAEAIAKELPTAVAVAPVVRARTQVVFGNKNWVPLYIYGTTPEFLDVRDWDVTDGRAFTDGRGGRVVRRLPGRHDDRPRAVRRRVAGRPDDPRQQHARWWSSACWPARGRTRSGADQDDIVLAPWRTIKFQVSGQSAQTANASAAAAGAATGGEPRRPGSRASSRVRTRCCRPPRRPTTRPPPLPTFVDQILVRIEDGGEIPAAMDQITSLLRERHRLAAGPGRRLHPPRHGRAVQHGHGRRRS